MANINDIQPYLPKDMTAASYQSYGGQADNYEGWLTRRLQDVNNNTPYATFDPRLFDDPMYRNLAVNGGDKSQMISGHGVGSAMQGDPTGLTQAGANRDALSAPDPNRLTQAQIQTQGNAYAKDLGFGQTNNTSGNAATPGALGALSKSPNLKNRKPNLGSSWGGWNGTTADGDNGSANFTYFSRFA